MFNNNQKYVQSKTAIFPDFGENVTERLSQSTHLTVTLDVQVAGLVPMKQVTDGTGIVKYRCGTCLTMGHSCFGH